MADLIRWDPFAGLSNLHSQIDDMFNGMHGFTNWPETGANSLAMDVYKENDKELVAEIHAPGFSKEDININVNNGILEIKGEKHEREKSKAKARNYMLRESHSSFYRSIMLPKNVNGDKVKARYVDGVLKITMPLTALPNPKHIAIEQS
ncbi:MAG: Hsp20/alpha crystallin family protein [Candidatus Saccharimonadales bacterium]|jgi:HSP20 family protein